MKTKLLHYLSITFITLSVLSILSVSIMAFVNPQQVMNLVQVNLSNTDAYSSIRGVYGGVGVTIITIIIYLSKQSISQGLMFLTLFWGMYAVSRLITMFVEGGLGAFGTQWLTIESFFTLIALVLFFFKKRNLKAAY